MNIREIKKLYLPKIDNLDLELIIARALGKPREFVLSHPEYIISATHSSQLVTLIERRLKHEPLAYILGEKEFYGLKFKVNKNVLVPRPETEQLVELVTQQLKCKNKSTMIVDVGTGSGNIIIAIAKQLLNQESGIRNYAFFATDISAKALMTAKQNAKLHKVDKKIKFLRGDLLKPILRVMGYGMRDTRVIITANLPYLDKKWRNLLKSSDSKSLKFEPKMALVGGFDGLDAYRSLSGQIRAWQEKNEHLSMILFCEIGHLQKSTMQKIFSFADKIKFHKDLSGKWRVCQIEIRSTKS